MLIWEKLHTDVTAEHLGLIPSFINEDDPAGIAAQIDKNYQHGGGWSPFEGFTFNPKTYSLTYPDDEPLHPIARTRLRGETLFLYPYAWVVVLQPDGAWEVARID